MKEGSVKGLPRGYAVGIDGGTKVLWAADNASKPSGNGNEWIEGDKRRMVARWTPDALTDEQIITIARLDYNSRRIHTNPALQPAARKQLGRFFTELGARARNGRLLRSIQGLHNTAE